MSVLSIQHFDEKPRKILVPRVTLDMECYRRIYEVTSHLSRYVRYLLHFIIIILYFL
jgi:hypothetical protein